jgi:3-deoxy-manno-octulosonate cytidylyltransferase (CMP-KDO synthetase)
MNVLGVIPARYQSTRLPGKPLADILGRPMIQWVFENVSHSTLLDEVIVAADDDRVIAAVERFDGKAVMTSRDHATGTDRVAEVAGRYDARIVVNIQGDEPFVNPGMIDEIVQPLLEDESIPMSTLMHRIENREDLRNPNVVKVVNDASGFALYFSRSLIPFPRHEDLHRAYEHIGIYAYRKDFLLGYAKMIPTLLEKTESLEQLRVLENGFRIRVVQTEQDYIPLSVDTQEDLEKARMLAQSAHMQEE